jgi:hypothetical protein
MTRLIILVLFFCPYLSYASHLLGGMMDLQWQGGKSYKLSVKVIWDCTSNFSASLDSTIVVGMFQKGTNTLVNSIPMSYEKFKEDTLKIPENCKETYRICTVIGTYSKLIELDSLTLNHPNGYYFNWQRCCKGSSVINILNSADMGLCLYLEVPRFGQIINSSPVIQKAPSLLLQSGFAYSYNFGFVDQDGDSLKYKLVLPLNGFLDRNNPLSNVPKPAPYPNVVLANGYSINNLIGGKQALRIDSNLGTLTGIPDKPGSYLIGVLVEEIRNGQKIGEVRLEVEINVVSDYKPAPKIILTSSDYTEIIGNNLEVHTTDSFYFKIAASTPYDSIYLQIMLADSILKPYATKPIFTPFSGRNLLSETNFAWKTYCHMEDSGQFIPITIKAYDNDCLFPNVTIRPLLLKITSTPRIKGPTEVCLGAQGIEFSLPQNLKGNTFLWTLPAKLKGIGSGHSLLVDFEYSIFNATISVSGTNACGNIFSTTHSVNTGNLSNAATITLSGHSLHSSILYGNQWFRNDTAIIGATDSYIELKSNGTYYTIINWLGCKSKPSNSFVADFFSATHEIPKALPQVKPNPFSENIEIQNTDWPLNAEVFLINAFGQILVQDSLHTSSSISTKDLAPGLYIFILKFGDQIYTKKMLKQ